MEDAGDLCVCVAADGLEECGFLWFCHSAVGYLCSCFALLPPVCSPAFVCLLVGW